MAITGSAGMGLSKIYLSCKKFLRLLLQREFYPQTDVVIELGGEDAKIIFLSGGLEERMNGSCAGGTGAFIDQMVALMDMSANELDILSK